jgi:hypothetical protein
MTMFRHLATNRRSRWRLGTLAVCAVAGLATAVTAHALPPVPILGIPPDVPLGTNPTTGSAPTVPQPPYPAAAAANVDDQGAQMTLAGDMPVTAATWCQSPTNPNGVQCPPMPPVSVGGPCSVSADGVRTSPVCNEAANNPTCTGAAVDCPNLSNLPALSVNGLRIGNVVLAQRVVTASSMLNLPTDSPAVREAAVSLVVLNELLYRGAAAHGLRPSDAEARAAAESNMQVYKQLAAQGKEGPLANGMSPEAFFLSPASIDFYARSIARGREREAIIHAGGAKPGAERDVFAAWLASTAPHYHITVAGLAPFDLAASLPGGW